MKDIPDKSIDLIVSDPPYFLGMTHNGQKGCFNDLKICEPFFSELLNFLTILFEFFKGSSAFNLLTIIKG